MISAANENGTMVEKRYGWALPDLPLECDLYLRDDGLQLSQDFCQLKVNSMLK